jgi:acyl-CoA thioester hydrolase
MSVSELLVTYPVTIERPVTWGQMDAFNHVNNTVYFCYFEDVRIATFEQVGFVEHMEKTQCGPILASTSCRFRVPLTYPDTLTIGCRIEDIGDDRFTMIYRVVSHNHDATAAEGEGRIVVFDYAKGQKAPLPGHIRSAMEALGPGSA